MLHSARTRCVSDALLQKPQSACFTVIVHEIAMRRKTGGIAPLWCIAAIRGSNRCVSTCKLAFDDPRNSHLHWNFVRWHDSR